jgi:SAM-dependent methyltransferase
MPRDDELAAARERGWRQAAEIDRAYRAGELDDSGWHAAWLAVLEPAYLAADNPRAQSGHSGDEQRWEYARRLIMDAVTGDGTFLDVGCASGHLMECVADWGALDGHAVEPYGVEISSALADLARHRCPQWVDRIWTANAMGWLPPRRFDVVRTGFYVPPPRRRDYVRHLLAHVVAPGGRLVIGVHNEAREADPVEAAVTSWGYRVAGRTSRPHRHPALAYRAFWIDAGQG